MPKHAKYRIRPGDKVRLKDFNSSDDGGLTKEAGKEEFAKLCCRLADMQELLYAEGKHALLVVLQAMDTAGKDSTIREVFGAFNPQGCRVVSFKAPSEEERAHDFLWRIHANVPRRGFVGVFNRSHYEDVLIVRVLKLQPERIWRQRYEQINAFEKHLAENRVILLKFFLHISKAEQAERLQARLTDKSKNWKFETGDLAMRARWSEFQRAYEDALNRCSTPWAPWHVVPADRKWYRDYVVSRVVLNALEKLKLKWPAPREDLSKIRIR